MTRAGIRRRPTTAFRATPSSPTRSFKLIDRTRSWVRKQLGIYMEGETTQHVWGVVDLVPETDFPDVRHRTLIHSDAGSCMIIPREGDEVRLYIQLAEGLEKGAEGRLDRSKVGPEKVMAVSMPRRWETRA